MGYRIGRPTEFHGRIYITYALLEKLSVFTQWIVFAQKIIYE